MLSLAAPMGLTGKGGEHGTLSYDAHRGKKERGALPTHAELIKIKRASFTQASVIHTKSWKHAQDNLHHR